MDDFVVGVRRFCFPAGEYKGLIHVQDQNFLVFAGILLHVFRHQKELFLGYGLEQEIFDLW